MKQDETIKSVTNCPTCGSECKVCGEGETHYYIPLLSKKPSVSDEEAQEWICKELKIDGLDFDERCSFDNGHIVNCFIDFKNKLTLPPRAECNGNCGMNYCDENGCIERKRNLVDIDSLTPPDAEKWISVEEKPKEDIHCLVFLYNPNTNDSWQETAYTLEGYFHGVMGKQEYITHWMPLPKPPINKHEGK